MSKKQTRILLWTVPRCISTAFFRAMMNRKNIKVFLEPYAAAYYLGPNRVSSRYGSESTNDVDTYKSIQSLLEQPYPEADEVFIKDHAYLLMNQLETTDLLPTGYIHTFLIRHPTKTVTSYYKASLDKDISGWDYFDPSTASYKESYTIFELVTKELGQKAIIVDGDDLLAHPEAVLREYCTQVGIEFQQSMLDWADDPQNHPVFQRWPQGWFKKALNSKGFEPSTSRPASTTTLPQEVQEVIRDSMPYYEKMYALRIKTLSAES